MTTDKPKKQVEHLWVADVSIQGPVYLREKIVDDKREIGERGSVSGDGVQDHFM